MTEEERGILITTCLLMTNYSEEYFDKLTDTELEKFYDEKMKKSIQK